MLQKFKKIGAVLIIMVLLPYIITIFMNGENISADKDTALDEY